MEIEQKAAVSPLPAPDSMDFEDDWAPDFTSSPVGLANPLQVQFTNQDYKAQLTALEEKENEFHRRLGEDQLVDLISPNKLKQVLGARNVSE